MKRLIFVLIMTAGLCIAQEGHEGAKDEEGGLILWKWANFLVLAGGLGYLVGKNAGPFFKARSAGIVQDMEDSLRLRKEAEARMADVDRRLAALETDIGKLRAESQQELEHGRERMVRQTADDIARIQMHASQEIASAGKAARLELKRYTVEVAIGIAGQKVRARMTPATQDGLVDRFVGDLR